MRTRTSWSRTRLIVALSMLVAATATSSMGSASPLPAHKVDPGVVSALLAGENPVNVIVSGHPHVGINADSFPSRSAAKAALSARSADFFDAVRDTVRENGGSVLETWGVGPAVHVMASPSTIDALASLPEVAKIEHDAPDAVGLIQPIPATGLEPANTGGRQQLQAEDIWALGFRGEGINISFIDTGIDPAHEAFKNADGSSRITAWKDWVGTSPTPYDDQGHGTHVAGTGAGSDLYNDPTFGLYQEVGVANLATIMVTKFLDSTGGGSFANAINALQWSYDNGADITSNSWGGLCSGSLSVIQVVRQLTDLGMLSVFAAGNSGGTGTIGGPACGESALSVGAIDQNKVIASFSSRGPCSDPDTGSGSRICPDIVAKGVAVRSSASRGSCTLCNATGYTSLNGTSMATPHAAGAVALAEQMKRFYTGTGWDTVARAEEEVFKLTAEDLGTADPDNSYGWGLPQLLNVYALVNATDEALIIDTFSMSKTVVRQGDSSTLSFGVRNLGGAIATGAFTAKLIDPNAGQTIIKSSTPSLGLLDRESATHNLVVGGSLVPGDYTFQGTFDYTWQDGNGDTQTGSVLREGVIKVARVFIEMTLAGLESEVLPILPQDVTFTATNTGNEDASGVVIEATFPDEYLFLPGENFTPANLNSRFANPTPTRIVEDRTFGRITLVFDVGTLAQGDSFSFTATLIPTVPGLYRTLTVAKFKDGAGKGFAQGSTTEQTVVLPE